MGTSDDICKVMTGLVNGNCVHIRDQDVVSLSVMSSLRLRGRASCRCTRSESGEEASDAGSLMSVGRRILGSVYATVVANGSRVQDSGVTGGFEEARG